MESKEIFTKAQLSIYRNLLIIWMNNSDLRFNQLISNLQVDFNNQQFRKYSRSDGTPDLFYLSDEKFAEFLEDLIEENS